MAKHVLDGVQGFVRRSEYFMIDPKSVVIDSGWNPRTDFTGEEELMASIVSEGVKIPIEVRKDAENILHLVDGERRLRAVLRAIGEGNEILAIPATVAPKGMNESELFIDAITRNTGKPLSPVEEAAAFKRLMNWGFQASQIALRFGKSEGHIRNRLQLQNAAPCVQTALSKGEISITDAMDIAKSPSVEDQAQKAATVRSPHQRKNIVISYSKKTKEIVYAGAGKGLQFDQVESLLFDDIFWSKLQALGFDPESIKIKIEPIKA